MTAIQSRVCDGLVAGGIAAIVSGAPSTIHALATGRDPMAATVAAGSLLLPGVDDEAVLIAAAVPVHVALSFGWGVVLSFLLPRHHALALGAVAGVAIAALDLGVVGRRNDRIRELHLGGQIADHVAFGAIVGWVVGRRRRYPPAPWRHTTPS